MRQWMVLRGRGIFAYGAWFLDLVVSCGGQDECIVIQLLAVTY